MADASTTNSPEGSSRRPWLRRLMLRLTLVLGTLAFIIYFSLHNKEANRPADLSPLFAAIEELDGRDPNWRLEDLESSRHSVPEPANAASRVLAAAKAMPHSWPDAKLVRELQVLPLPDLMNAKQAQALHDELRKAELALKEAAPLKELRQGRYQADWRADYLSPSSPHLQDIRDVARLLAFQARAKEQDDDATAALALCRAVLNTGRSLGDEPKLSSQLVRVQTQLLAIRVLERALAEGRPTEIALKETQELLQDEADQPLLLIAARGTRAVLHGLMLSLETGELDLAALAAAESGKRVSPVTSGVRAILSDEGLRQSESLQKGHAWLLRYLSRFVEIARLPPQKQYAKLADLTATAERAPQVAQHLAPAIGEIALVFIRSQAHLRCAIAALAVERYRNAKHSWPEKLDALTPNYLLKVPTDPFDDAPLRYRQYPQGVVIYSIGSDGEDNRGRFDVLNTFEPSTDQGFRLWNIDQRRRNSR